MVEFRLPTTEEVNAKLPSSVGQTMETMLGNLQPEAASFCPRDGERGGYLVFNMEEESRELVTKLQPLWLEMKATVGIVPVMTADDLRASPEVIEQLREAA